MKSNISCVLCVLNEIENIGIIKSNIVKKKDIEFVIVDGGSTDGTFEILNNMQEENIKLISLKNQGLLSQRVMGIKKSKSEVCLLIDADDNLENINIKNLRDELIYSNYHGLTLQLRYSNPKNYSEF